VGGSVSSVAGLAAGPAVGRETVGAVPAAGSAAIPFPSRAWFEALAARVREQRVRWEHLGYVDCVAGFTVLDGPGGAPFRVQVSFDEFDVVDVREAREDEGARADFVLEADLATWRAMIESIAAGHGRPALEQTLNRLSHMGKPIAVRSDDPLRRDLYFRYNQSLQEFVNASAGFRTAFPD
jgi:hypothetical protein